MKAHKNRPTTHPQSSSTFESEDLGKAQPVAKLRLTLAASCLAALLLTACGGLDHVLQAPPVGQSSSYLIQKFGYPSEVKDSVGGAKTWIYQTGGRTGSWEYTIKNERIVNCVYISNR